MAVIAAGPAAVSERLGLEGLHLTRRGRRLLSLLVLLVAVPLVQLGAQAVAGAPAEPVEVRLHNVAPGETLWQYAGQVAAPGEDLRDVVAYLRELNGMRTSQLQAGQLVLLPRE